MNQRIQELAEQSGFPAKRSFSDLSDLYPRLDKFAELIEKDSQARHFSEGYTAGQSDGTIQAVKQCLFLCDQVDLVGADDCMSAIKEHFGVEE